MTHARPGRTRSQASFLIHLTVEERDLILQHAHPDTSLEELLSRARVAGPLVSLELTTKQLGEFLQIVDDTGNNAQDIDDGERIGFVARRLESGLNGTADPGAHLLRPAAAAAGYTARQGQFLAFIHSYQRLHRRSPAEADLQEFFQVTPPSVHQMVLTLERRGFIRRRPGQARSITLLLRPDQIPELEPADRRRDV